MDNEITDCTITHKRLIP